MIAPNLGGIIESIGSGFINGVRIGFMNQSSSPRSRFLVQRQSRERTQQGQQSTAAMAENRKVAKSWRKLRGFSRRMRRSF